MDMNLEVEYVSGEEYLCRYLDSALMLKLSKTTFTDETHGMKDMEFSIDSDSKKYTWFYSNSEGSSSLYFQLKSA